MSGRHAYDEDYYAWTQEQARLLREAARERINTAVDWEHIAEEIEDMGKSDRRLVGSHLARVVEHLLKLEFSPAAAPRGGWRKTVLEQRASAIDALDDSPSLKGKLAIGAIYRRGRRFASEGLGQDQVEERLLPADCPYSLDQLLDEDWWPVSRHGHD
ncbi:DUF29 domain-containing protein [Azospirillum sp. ST 5-10]